MSIPEQAPAQHRLQVEVWSDLACPWCYVGKRRLERAVRGFEHPGEVLVRHRSFELDPRRPDRRPFVQHLADRYGGPVAAREVGTRVNEAAREEDLRFDFERAVQSSTFDAHRLCHLGLDQGGPAQQAAVLERLFTAQFVEGRHLDDPDALQRLGAEAGLDEVLLASVLAGEEYAEQVRQDEALAVQLGISSVPYVLVNGGVRGEGPQSVDELVALLQQAWRGLGGPPAAQPDPDGSVSSSN
ncbi:DsbA family oxidoreductase [Segeticoccus rhizosphaerae]|uniref:DsbA family oxidoreductase n=1 Tax=Segeticoccus rhizosphaerae TaxID=1104777 RepID=UPI001264D7FE|nr:DsbA family oxidoreductase [Segeticoccus rhizosphaerae]